MRSQYSSGALLGPYELLLPLSQTGAAEVWVGRLIGTGGFRAHVLLKVIPRACFDDMPTEHLLLEQSALAARARHPNLVQVQDLGEQGDTLYVAMEWVDGVTLRVLLDEAGKRGGLPLPIAVNLIAQLCRGLHAIHELRDADGVPVDAVHGHVSPRNVLVGYNGNAKLSDFGIARVMDRLSFLTGASEHNHKLTFAAPEQLGGGHVDRRSDVFCIGTLLYLLTTSRHPFAGADVRATLHNICSKDPAAPPERATLHDLDSKGDPSPGDHADADYPEPLSEIVMMALSKSPHERFATALELLDALEATMPECFQPGAEQALAAYVEGLCSRHQAELRARIHAVAVKHDRARSSLPPPLKSAGESLRAVTLDPTPSESYDGQSLIPPARLPGVYRSNLRRAAPLAMGLPAAFLVCLWLLRGHGSQPGDEPGSAAAREALIVPEITVRSLPVPEAATPATEALIPNGTPTPAPEANLGKPGETAESTPLPVTSVAALPLAPHAPLPRSMAARRAPVPAKASVAPEPTPSPAPASEPARKANSWDPSTFGGRY
jgi:serine/threonine-protein kinase